MAKVYKLILELARRKVIRVSGAYVAIVWLLAQGVADIFPAFGLPDWTVRAFIITGILGLPIVVALAWKFDITPQGIIRDPGPGSLNTQSGAPLSFGQVGLAERLEAAPSIGLVRAKWTDDKGRERSEDFFDSFLIGRDPVADIRFSDPRVSRRHSLIFAEGDRWFIRDLGSSNGTFINGCKVHSTPLPKSCKLQLEDNGPILEIQVQSPEETLVTDGKTNVRTNR